MAPNLVFAQDWESWFKNQVNSSANQGIQNINIPDGNPMNATSSQVQNLTGSGLKVGLDMWDLVIDSHSFIVRIVEFFTGPYNVSYLIIWIATWAVTAGLAAYYLKKSGKGIVITVILVLGFVLLLIALGFVHH